MVDLILGFISDTVNAVDQAYDLAGKMISNYRTHKGKKEQNKIKQELKELRNLTGQIDRIYSKLSIQLKMMEEQNQTNSFLEHIDKFQKLENKISNLREIIYRISESSYFHRVPELRDILHFKAHLESKLSTNLEEKLDKLSNILGEKNTMDSPKNFEDDLENQSSKTFAEFKNYLENTRKYTRTALTALNNHLETKFS